MTISTEQKILTAADALPGRKYVISYIDSGLGLKSHLTSMGLVPNETFSVLNQSGGGPVTIVIKGVRIAIGRGMAMKIIIREVESKKNKRGTSPKDAPPTVL